MLGIPLLFKYTILYTVLYLTHAHTHTHEVLFHVSIVEALLTNVTVLAKVENNNNKKIIDILTF